MLTAVKFDRRAVIGGLAGTVAAVGICPVCAVASTADDVCVWNRRPGDSPAVAKAIRDLVIANRILAREGVMDAYGHVSIRHPERPDRFLISVSRSPELVTPEDITEINYDGSVAVAGGRQSYAERFIHGSIYRARPDIKAVAHSHAPEVLPFTVSSVPMRIVTHSAGVVGEHVPVWDIRDKFGDTNLLLDTDAMGRDLATRLGQDSVVLMRAHGFAAGGTDLIELVRICIYLGINAKVLLEALRLGKVTYLTPGEIRRVKNVGSGGSGLQRAWEYWARRADCTALLQAP